MIIFILIFFAVVIAVGSASVLGFSFYLKRQKQSLETDNRKQFFEQQPRFRSLFELSDEEIRALEREEPVRAETENKEIARKILFEKAEAAFEFQKIWAKNPNKRSTIELFRLAAESANAGIFSETVESVIQVWRAGKLNDLSAKDLVQLAESHLRILPQMERNSAGIFWLKQEIADLRSNREKKSGD